MFNVTFNEKNPKHLYKSKRKTTILPSLSQNDPKMSTKNHKSSFFFTGVKYVKVNITNLQAHPRTLQQLSP